MGWIEVVSGAVFVLSVAGVMFNNRRRRACFVLWLASNAASLGVHAASGLWVMAGRDLVFAVLAVEGWVLWSRRTDALAEGTEDTEQKGR